MKDSSTRLRWEPITLQLRNPFRVSYGVSETRQAFWLRLANDEGWGEGTIPPYYGVKQEAMFANWQAAAQRTDPFPEDPAEIGAWVGEAGPAPARCALDLALHDRLGRQRNLPLHTLLGVPKPPPMATSFTLGMDTPERMAEMARKAAGYPILKLKLGSDDDEARVAAVRRARPDAHLCVDANAGWSPEDAVQRVRSLLRYGLIFVEQPVPKDEIEGMGYVQAHLDIPVVADESVQTLDDVERLAAAGVQGINLKLMKVGGLAPGLRLLQRARQLGMGIMLGCMVETSLGTTAMAHLAGLADWLDLDAPLLISNDPFAGLRYDEGARIHLPPRPGIGALRVSRKGRTNDEGDELDARQD